MAYTCICVKRIIPIFFAGLLIASNAHALVDVENVWGDVPDAADVADVADELVTQLHEVKGKLNGEEHWKEGFCHKSHYSYHVDLKADLATVDFALNENGSINVYADLYDLWGRAEGAYRSMKTLCIPFRKVVELGIDRAEVLTQVTFTGTGESLKDVEVRVLETKLGTLRFGKHCPDWFERWVTRLANKTLAKMWASSLGEWISAKITELIKEKVPGAQAAHPQWMTQWNPVLDQWTGELRLTY